MQFMNLTPHALGIQTPAGTLTVPTSGTIARVTATDVAVPIDTIVPVVRRVYGAVEGLPAPAQGVAYLVSALVLAALAGRQDVFAPDTGPTAVRDENGHILAVTRLVAAP